MRSRDGMAVDVNEQSTAAGRLWRGYSRRYSYKNWKRRE
jgi:hypothetical protein